MVSWAPGKRSDFKSDVVTGYEQVEGCTHKRKFNVIDNIPPPTNRLMLAPRKNLSGQTKSHLSFTPKSCKLSAHLVVVCLIRSQTHSQRAYHVSLPTVLVFSWNLTSNASDLQRNAFRRLLLKLNNSSLNPLLNGVAQGHFDLTRRRVERSQIKI